MNSLSLPPRDDARRFLPPAQPHGCDDLAVDAWLHRSLSRQYDAVLAEELPLALVAMARDASGEHSRRWSGWPMRVTVIQMSPGDAFDANLAAARRLVAEAVRVDRSDLIALPETWSCIGGTRETKLAASATYPSPDRCQTMASMARFDDWLAKLVACFIAAPSASE